LALALAILAERRLGTSSQYAAYIELLPGEELTASLPVWWPEEELLSLLGGSRLERAAVILLVYCCSDTTGVLVILQVYTPAKYSRHICNMTYA